MSTLDEQVAALQESVRRLERRGRLQAWIFSATLACIVGVGFAWDRFGQNLGRTATAAQVRTLQLVAPDLESEPDPANDLFQLFAQQNRLANESAKPLGWLSFGFSIPTMTMETNTENRKEVLYKGHAKFDVLARPKGDLRFLSAEASYSYLRKERRWTNAGWHVSGAEDLGIGPEVRKAMRDAFGKQ